MEYLNRDISWLSFNLRVSDETKKDLPLAERVLFHGITHSNLDEFVQVRYPTFCDESDEAGLLNFQKAVTDHYDTLMHRFQTFNKKYGIVRKVNELKPSDQKWAEKMFKQDVFPALQPITIDKSRQINPRAGIYLLVVTEDKDRDDEEFVNYIEIPRLLDRFIQVPGRSYCIAIEDLIKYNLKYVFKDRKITNVFAFSILRSAEVYTQTDQHLDPYQLISQTLKEREKAWITQLEVASSDKKSVKLIRSLIPLVPNSLVFTTRVVGLADLKKIPSGIYSDENKARKLVPYNTFPNTSIFDYIKKEDRLAFHPFESYDTTMVRFLKEAADDPNVISIKISLYRVSDNSQIIDALLRAADKGKVVTVLVELKARFDEHHNMEISNALREGGVRIVYTKPDIKTHAKVCLVTRKEKKGIRIYAQVGTGNYSESNAKQYTDYSYFTARQDVAYDLTRFFNLLTSDQGTFKSQKIIYAPYNMRDEINAGIDHEIKRAKDGKSARIICKCNAFTDDKIADKIVEAAKAGVKVVLIVRGACILPPMKNVKIFSIVGRFLEHSRVYCFGTGKHTKLYIGSSDLMHRNLSLRNELLILVESQELKERIMKHLRIYQEDNTNRRVILDKYQYKDVAPKKDEKKITAQDVFIKEAKKLALS